MGGDLAKVGLKCMNCTALCFGDERFLSSEMAFKELFAELLRIPLDFCTVTGIGPSVYSVILLHFHRLSMAYSTPALFERANCHVRASAVVQQKTCTAAPCNTVHHTS